MYFTIFRRLLGFTIVFLPIIFAFWGKQYLDAFSQSPSDDPPVTIDDDITIHPSEAFSGTYKEARGRFTSTARQFPEAVLIALDIIDNLTMDIVVLPGDLPGLVVLTSGTHGVEGYAGSAIQVAYLQKCLKLQDKCRTSSPTVVFVHSVNPWGMDSYRRTNENNVDLNRNALASEQFEKLATEHVNHVAYEKFDLTLFNPIKAPTLFFAAVGMWTNAAAALVRHGFVALKTAMVGGQYYNPRGIFYGGDRLQKSLQILDAWMAAFLGTRPADEVVTWIDVHTGLGPMGKDTLLLDERAYTNDSTYKDMVSRDLTNYFPGAQTPLDSNKGAGVNQGYDHAKGFVIHYFANKYLSPTDLVAVQEFGTVPAVLVAHALICENAARHHLSKPEALKWAEATTKRAFYPQNTKWRRNVLTRGLRLLDQAKNRSSSLSRLLSTTAHD